MCEHCAKKVASIVLLCGDLMPRNVSTVCDLDGEQCAKTVPSMCEARGKNGVALIHSHPATRR